MGLAALKVIKKFWRWVEGHARWFLAGGLLVAAGYNWIKWRADRLRLREIQTCQAPPLLPLDAIQNPKVTVLLPAWNEADNLVACLDSLLGLRYPDVEIILCAGGQDATLTIAKRYAGPKVVVLEQQPGEGKQGALRRSFAHATGGIIFLTDADCILDDAIFERTLAPILTGDEVAATGAWRPFERQQPLPLVQYQWAHHLYRELWMPDYAPALDGRNAAVRREALEAADAFEISAPVGADLALSKQLTAAGYAICFVRDSHVQTEYPETVHDYRKQLSRWFRNPLVHEKRWLAAPLARSHLRAGLAAIFLVVAPLPALFSTLVAATWTSVVFHLLLAQLRTWAVLAKSVGSQMTVMHPFTTLTYLPVGWWTTARGMIALLVPSEKHQW
ncbi:MAG: glycosyltransferase family 2 protein [Anaerolineae bacterium]|nr:glycosyltransferase family 2 protein [Anaerolineae bacterium]